MRNKQVIQSLFPLQWKKDFLAPKFDQAQASLALQAIIGRQGRSNSALGREEAFTIKDWVGGARQAVKYLLRKRSGQAVPLLPQIALTLSDLRGANKVDESDVQEALRYMSKLEISPFVSGTKRSSGSYPERNSTAMP